MIKSKPKIAIVGAGFVGASTAFAMSLNQLAGEVVLIDVNKEKAIGEAMDINHGLSFLGQMSVYAGDYSDCADCDVIVITAGLSRKPGETRLDLAKKNVAIAKDMASNIMKHYTRGVILVVSNPVDILTYTIQKCTGLPSGRVLGTGTVLDSSRFRYLLSKKLRVDVRNVHGYIIGEHGDSQLPAWSATHIAGKNIEEYCNTPGSGFTETDKSIIANEVKNAGAEIIKNKGATYYAIAVTVNTIVESLLKNQNTIRTVSSVINGAYGINDIALSLPSMINYNGVYDILHLNLSAEEEAALRLSAEQIKAIVKEL
jgi:L-lactate dehydrogenase